MLASIVAYLLYVNDTYPFYIVGYIQPGLPVCQNVDREREISIGRNKEYKKEKIFYMDVLKTIHKKISNQKMKSKERDKSILEYVQCMYNNVHTYKVPGF